MPTPYISIYIGLHATADYYYFYGWMHFCRSLWFNACITIKTILEMSTRVPCPDLASPVLSIGQHYQSLWPVIKKPWERRLADYAPSLERRQTCSETSEYTCPSLTAVIFHSSDGRTDRRLPGYSWQAPTPVCHSHSHSSHSMVVSCMGVIRGIVRALIIIALWYRARSTNKTAGIENNHAGL